MAFIIRIFPITIDWVTIKKKSTFPQKATLKKNIKFNFFLHKQSVNHWVCYQTRHALVGNLARSVEIAEKKVIVRYI